MLAQDGTLAQSAHGNRESVKTRAENCTCNLIAERSIQTTRNINSYFNKFTTCQSGSAELKYIIPYSLIVHGDRAGPLLLLCMNLFKELLIYAQTATTEADNKQNFCELNAFS